eukprot:NODE_130_length_18488_cov_0.389961.p8 type:complete len:196 gc:universal NODE_130_length_18488_cov_0.389961:4787-4200(-)
MRQCRICFDSEEQDSLISPCLCKGSSKWVHTECLNQWRAQSQRSFYTCPSCKYEYRIQRLKWAKYIQNPLTLTVVTIIIIFIIILLLAYFLNYFLYVLGTGVVQNAWQISRQVVWWATLSLGMVAFLFLTEKDNLSFFDFDLFTFGGASIMYSTTILGLISLFYLLYNGVRYYCMQMLNILGDKILQVDSDEKEE